MTSLHIEHAVPDFAAWKRTFDAYAGHRARGGVRAYRISRPIDDPGYAIIDLDFDDPVAATAFLTMLRGLWERVDGTIVIQPRATIVETIEELPTLVASPRAT